MFIYVNKTIVLQNLNKKKIFLKKVLIKSSYKHFAHG